MSSLITFVLLASLAITVNGDCFKIDELNKFVDDDLKEETSIVMKKCKEESPSATEKEIEDCADKIIEAAAEECSKDNPDKDERKWYICYREKIGSEKPTDEELSFDYFKKEMLRCAKDGKTKIISDTMDECKSENNFYICCYKKLAEGPCPDVEPLYKNVKEWENMQE